MSSVFLRHWGPLLALDALVSIALSIYIVAGAAPSDRMWILSSLSLEFFIVLWVMNDARERMCVPCFDFGFFVLAGFPVSVVWYLFWTRSWRAFITLGIFLGLYLIPWLCAVALWMVIRVLWD